VAKYDFNFLVNILDMSPRTSTNSSSTIKTSTKIVLVIIIP